MPDQAAISGCNSVATMYGGGYSISTSGLISCSGSGSGSAPGSVSWWLGLGLGAPPPLIPGASVPSPPSGNGVGTGGGENGDGDSSGAGGSEGRLGEVDPCRASCPVGCDGPADASKPQCADCAACRNSEDTEDPCDPCCPVGTCDGPHHASKPQCADCAACQNDPAPTRSCPGNEDSAAASLGTGALGTTLLVTATTALVLRKWQ